MGWFSCHREGRLVGGLQPQYQHQFQRTTTKGFGPMFTKCELSFSAFNLLDRDIASKSDPMILVYAMKQDGKLEELGRTEVIINCLNPEWEEKIAVVFQFEIVQPLEFHLYEVDAKYHGATTKTIKLKDQDFIGKASCMLSQIVTKHGKSLTLKLQNKNEHGGLRDLGTLTVHTEETAASTIGVKMDPFLKISRVIESGESIPIFRTEVINKNLNPTWKPVSLSSHHFGSKDTPLLIECFDFDSSGNHVLVGKLWSSIADLEKHHKERTCSNFFLQSKHHGKDKILKSQLFVDQYSEKEQFSFINYISSGFELNFLVAVDFTSSNGNPRCPDSLHYIDPSGRLNPYQKAIMEVGEVIQFYDPNRQFHAMGFAGKIEYCTVSHCFNLNGSSSSSEVVGVEGIMGAYASSLHNVTLSGGPTLFGPVIKKAAEMAANSLYSYNCTKYYVLLIITDGVALDLEETLNALVDASGLPLSVFVVGVENFVDFTIMEVLNADNSRHLACMTTDGSVRVATRDMVQFVPMKEVQTTRDMVQFIPMKEVQSSQISEVQALLEELPDQFLAFMRSRDIKPLTSHFLH